jgi:hypothetical protein
MPHNAPSPSLSFLFPFLLLAGPTGVPAFGQSNVRPVPVVGRAPATGGEHFDSRKAEEASYLLSPGGAAAWSVALDLEATLLSSADLEDGGERSVQRGGWSATLTRDLGDRSTTFYLDAEASFYDWSAPAPLAAGSPDPFNDLYLTRLGALAEFDEDAALSWFTGAEITVSGEDDAGIQDALSLGAVSGVRCRASKDLTLEFGLAALTRLEDHAWLLPYFGFDLRLSERWRLATDGARVLLEAELSDDVTAALAAEYDLRQFRLNDDNALSEGVYQDDEIRLSAELVWRLGEHATLACAAGLVAWQESTFLDDSGTELGEVETDPAPYATLALRLGN